MSAEQQGLKKLLANSYTLYLKTHNFHWNVEGERFISLHQLFEQQYTELALAVDEIAERIRAKGVYAPGSYSEFAELSDIQESLGRPPKANQMIEALAADHLAVAKSAHSVITEAESNNDPVTADLATQRATVHEKTAWMLRALLA